MVALKALRCIVSCLQNALKEEDPVAMPKSYHSAIQDSEEEGERAVRERSSKSSMPLMQATKDAVCV